MNASFFCDGITVAQNGQHGTRCQVAQNGQQVFREKKNGQ